MLTAQLAVFYMQRLATNVVPATFDFVPPQFSMTKLARKWFALRICFFEVVVHLSLGLVKCSRRSMHYGDCGFHWVLSLAALPALLRAFASTFRCAFLRHVNLLS